MWPGIGPLSGVSPQAHEFCLELATAAGPEVGWWLPPMPAPTLDPDAHVIDLCVITNQFGGRVFEIPHLPRGP